MTDEILATEHCASTRKRAKVFHVTMVTKLTMVWRVVVERGVRSGVEHVCCHQYCSSPKFGRRARVQQSSPHPTHYLVANFLSHAILMLLMGVAVLQCDAILLEKPGAEFRGHVFASPIAAYDSRLVLRPKSCKGYSPAPSQRMTHGLCCGPRAARALVHTC